MTFLGNGCRYGGEPRYRRACAWYPLAAEGADVTVVDLLDGTETIDAITEAGGSARQMTCDVSDEESVLAVFRECFPESRPLDFLVHCAGIIHERPLLDTPVEEFDRVIAVNLRGAFLGGARGTSLHVQNRKRTCHSDLIRHGVLRGRETFSPDVASKHGVMGLVKSWAYEFSPSINVNALCPGR